MQLRLVSLSGLAVLGACQSEERAPPIANVTANESSSSPVLPLPDPPLDRTGMLRAVVAAASAAALGQPDVDQQKSLEGRRLEVRIRLGCPGSPDTAGGPFIVDFDEAKRTLRIRAAPDISMDDARIAAVAGEGVEAVEGFWIPRPWLLTAGCPMVVPPASTSADHVGANAPQERQRTGLAQFYTEADARTGRRHDRPFETTTVLAAEERPSAQGYNLVLSGRLQPLANGITIACKPAGDAPPDCVVSAKFDRIWIEQPETKAIVAEWTS